MRSILLSEYERAFKRKKTSIGILVYCFLLTLECVFLYLTGGISFYDANHSVQLNSINTASFFLRELGLFINFILIPMFVVDSFNGEYSSGALRLVLIRPQKRVSLFLAKWIVQASLILALTVFTWLIATIFGQMIMPYVSETNFLNTESMNIFEGLIYSIKFYGLSYVIFLCVIGLSSFMSIVMPNPIMAYMGTVACLIGGVYISGQFIYFVIVSDSVFEVLGNANQYGFYSSLLFLFVISHIMSIGIWNRKQWMG
ncbi:ABC transporter permease [Sporosarcina limicola]|uniref:ABC-type transport system involved in multi-copper enzyme maturation permease subunit n=1 Tax=Sporosarcina limicola TaxID=34101 RepID=A0A927MPX7_9BACL|nr:ABC transporter permease [Sporosarcina limicola]MBE1555369.1 ABC-type transport system involved in multi-copper enzyme maturation permease subunit [Sporosarcina limicola]